MLTSLGIRLAVGYALTVTAWVEVGRSGSPSLADNESAVILATWVLTGLGLAWLGISVLYLALGHRRRVTTTFFTFPGAQNIARLAFATSITAVASCGSGQAPVLTYVGEATTALAPSATSSSLDPTTTTPITNAPTTTSSTVPPATTTAPAEPLQDPIESTEDNAATLELSAPEEREPTEHTVIEGEHLWGIAEARLSELASPTTDEVATYWRRLVEQNRPSLSSGDPNLIFPGEVIVLPD